LLACGLFASVEARKVLEMDTSLWNETELEAFHEAEKKATGMDADMLIDEYTQTVMISSHYRTKKDQVAHTFWARVSIAYRREITNRLEIADTFNGIENKG
jgi:hypothetical protein